MDKYLTILAGNPRGGEQTWQTLYDKVLTPLHSDLAILTGEKWLDSQSFLKESKYKWILDEDFLLKNSRLFEPPTTPSMMIFLSSVVNLSI